METEQLKIFDREKNPIGVTSREEVHRLGHWHETFHCWFISSEGGRDYVYLQMRSDSKKDYPGLLDITAAGHLLAKETVHDGVREIEEELGVKVAFHDLSSLGIIDYSVYNGELIDKEFAHVFLYDCSLHFNDFKLQAVEVSGIVRTEFKQFASLWIGETDEIEVEGFYVDNVGNKKNMTRIVTKNHFVPHESSYYEAIIHGIRTNMTKNQLPL